MTQKKKKQNSVKDEFKDKLMEYFKQDQKLCEKLGITKRPIITFKRKKVPLLSRIAINIIRKQGGILDIEFTDKNATNNKK